MFDHGSTSLVTAVIKAITSKPTEPMLNTERAARYINLGLHETI